MAGRRPTPCRQRPCKACPAAAGTKRCVNIQRPGVTELSQMFHKLQILLYATFVSYDVTKILLHAVAAHRTHTAAAQRRTLKKQEGIRSEQGRTLEKQEAALSGYRRAETRRRPSCRTEEPYGKRRRHKKKRLPERTAV